MAEFDYAGWSLYNSWRRTVLLNPGPSTLSENQNNNNNNNNNKKKRDHRDWGDEYAAKKAECGNVHTDSIRPQEPFNDRRDGLFVRKKHNCWLHCDFPSECHHAIYKAQEEGRPILAVAEALDALYAAVTPGDEEAARVDSVGRLEKRAKSTVDTKIQLSPVKEDVDEVEMLGDDTENNENVSPCSPEPPKDLMCEREVSPITPVGEDGQSSAYSTKDVDSKMRTNTDPNSPSVKATSLEFEVYVEDTHTITTHLTVERYHDDGLDGLSAELCDKTQEIAETGGQFLTVDDLESAYSEKAWFTTTEEGELPNGDSSPHKGLERHCRRDRMLALLGRRNAITTITIPSDSIINRGTTSRMLDTQCQEKGQPLEGSEDWESGSDASSSSSCSVSSLLSSSSDDDVREDLVVVNLDGDSPMLEALSPTNEEDAYSMLSPVMPVKEDGKDDEPDLMTLLRMRNAFMRGDN